MARTKKADKCGLVLPYGSWALIAAAACAAVGLPIEVIAVDAERCRLRACEK